MRKALLFLSLIVASLTHTNAQNDNPCTQDWGKWLTVYSFAPGVDLQVSFKYQIKGRKGGDCGQSYYRFSKPIIKKGAHIEFKFDYRKKDGTIGTESFSFVELNKVGISEDNNSNFYQGYEMVRIYDAKLVDPERDKSVQMKTDINTAVQNYDQQYNEANTALAKVQDATKRNNLQTRLTDNRNSLLQYKAQAQQQLNNSDAMTQTLASIKQNQEDLKSIGLDIDFANKRLPIETKKQAPIKNNGMGDAMGRRADNTGSGTAPQSAAITNNNVVDVQKRQYQQQANNYIDAANNSTDGIQKATNLSLAKINAQGSGNAAQVTHIQQVQNQQVAQNLTDLGSQLTALVNKPQPELKKLTESEYNAKIDRDVTASMKAQGYEFDDNGGAYNPKLFAYRAGVEAFGTTLTDKRSFPEGFITKSNLTKEEEKITEIKKWIVSKMVNYPGYFSSINDLLPTPYIVRYLIDEDETNDQHLVLKNINRSGNKIIPAILVDVFDIKWPDIIVVKIIPPISKDSTTVSGTLSMTEHTRVTAAIQITTQPDKVKWIFKNAISSTPGINESSQLQDNAVFYINQTGEEDLTSRLEKAFNDLITYYKKNKPKELY